MSASFAYSSYDVIRLRQANDKEHSELNLSTKFALSDEILYLVGYSCIVACMPGTTTGIAAALSPCGRAISRVISVVTRRRLGLVWLRLDFWIWVSIGAKLGLKIGLRKGLSLGLKLGLLRIFRFGWISLRVQRINGVEGRGACHLRNRSPAYVVGQVR